MRFARGAILVLFSIAGLLAQPAVKNVEIYGQTIHYVEAGSSGPTIILLHGLGADLSSWDFTTPALAPKYHVYAPDQLGFGQSAKPLIDYRVGTLVDVLEGFYRKLGIAKATLVGNSLGGWVAMLFTIEHPEMVDKLVLIDSAGLSTKITGATETPDFLFQLNPSTVAGMKKLLGLVFYNQAMFANDAVAREAFAIKLKKGDGYTVDQFIHSILRGEDFVDGRLGAIAAPTLVLWGRQDRLIPLATAKLLAVRIHGAQLEDFDGCGHVPQIECAPQVNAALLKFLQ
jgi:pimeloyl-ACP methyl ester carboxylesterase